MNRRHTKIEEENSVANLCSLLAEVVRKPSAFSADVTLAKSLRTQGALAKFEVVDRAIIPMSLNHQKVVSASLGGGFDRLNSLRKLALDALRKGAKGTPKKPSKDLDQTKEQLRRSQAEAQRLREDLWLVQRAYDTRCRQARSYAAQAGPSVVAICQQEQRECDASLSLLRDHWVSNVSSIPGCSDGAA